MSTNSFLFAALDSFRKNHTCDTDLKNWSCVAGKLQCWHAKAWSDFENAKAGRAYRDNYPSTAEFSYQEAPSCHQFVLLFIHLHPVEVCLNYMGLYANKTTLLLSLLLLLLFVVSTYFCSACKPAFCNCRVSNFN